MKTLILKNPHSIRAAIDCRPGDVVEVVVSPDSRSALHQEVVSAAEKNGIRVTIGKSPKSGGDFSRSGRFSSKSNSKIRRRQNASQKASPREDSRSGSGNSSQKTGRDSGLSAVVKPKRPVEFKELFQNQTGSGLWLALDCIQDPHNLGSIFRSAAFFGVRGIFMVEDRAVGLTPVVYDVAAGGVECVPHAVETNFSRALRQTPEFLDIWSIGSSEHAEKSVFELAEDDRNWLLVLGNEEKGIRPKAAEICDFLAAIPKAPSAALESLNVSVAAGIMISALSRNSSPG